MNSLRNRSLAKGFSLVELLVAMGISMVLLGALSSIFANSIQTREVIDKEGQKLENARYSLDTLAEDVRLAGYYGILAPGLAGVGLVNGATAADYTYVDPCDVPATPSGFSGLSTSWDSTGASNITIPMPIFGYQYPNPPSPANVRPTGLPTCIPFAAPPLSGANLQLPLYKLGTDVLVLRRASTSTAASVASGDVNPYLQIQSCPTNQPTQPPGFVAGVTGDGSGFSRLALDCVTTASVRRLIYRIYYIAQCDDCLSDLDLSSATPGDGVPSLKMIELQQTATNAEMVYQSLPSPSWNNNRIGQLALSARTIAPNVVDMHIEYGIDTTDDGSIDAWTVSNNDPRQTGSTGTVVTGMRLDAGNQNRWEDVMAIKLFLITRDTKPTTGYTDTKTFIAGTKTIPAANDAYRRRLMSTTIKLVNMAGRREAP